MKQLWLPSVEVESAHGTREVSLYTRHLMNRIIFLEGEIDAEMANGFLQQFLYLQQQPSTEPIRILINSPGGEVNAGLMIYDLIQGSTADIDIICTGKAASMAAVILAGGKKGRRYILEHSEVMIHEPILANGVGGSVSSIRKISDSVLKTREMVNGILAKHTGKKLATINKATSFDNYMNAKAAIKFGICDKVIKQI